MVKCPYCHEDVKYADKKCKKCKKNIEEYYICGNCEKTFIKRNFYCDECDGEVLTKEAYCIKNTGSDYFELSDLTKIASKFLEQKEEYDKFIEDYQNKINVVQLDEKDFHYHRANLDLANKNFDRALESLNYLLENYPSDILTIELNGAYYFYQKKWDKAIKYYEKVLQRDSENYNGIMGYAFALYYMDRYDESFKYLDKMLEKNPTDCGALMHYALYYSDNGDLEHSLEYFNKVEDKDRDDDYYFYKTGVFIDYNKLNEATECFKRLCDLNPKYKHISGIKEKLVNALKENGEPVCFKEDEEIIIKCPYCNSDIVLNKDNECKKCNHSFDSFYICLDCMETYIGTTHFCKKCNGDKITTVERCVEEINGVNNIDIDCLYDVFCQKVAYSLAFERFDQALNRIGVLKQLFPFRIFNYNVEAFYHMVKGEYVESMELYDKYLDFDLNNVKALSGKGSCLYHLGKKEEAKEYFDKSLKIDSKYNFTLSQVAIYYHDKGDYDKALNYLNQIFPPNGDVFIYKADIFTELGNFKKAEEYLNKAKEINPDDEEIPIIESKLKKAKNK